MNPSDQRRVRAAIEPGRRSHRVAGWLHDSANRRLPLDRGRPAADRGLRRGRARGALRHAALGHLRGSAAPQRAPLHARAEGRLAGGRGARAALDQGQLHARAALRAHAGGPRLRRLRAGRAARRARGRRAAAADLGQRHGQDAPAARARRRHRRAHHARQRPRDRARARRRPRSRPPRPGALPHAPALSRAAGPLRLLRGLRLRDRAGVQARHPDRRARRGRPRGRRGARARRARPDVAPRPPPQRSRDLGRVCRERRRDGGRAGGRVGRLAAARARPRRRLRGPARSEHVGLRR